VSEFQHYPECPKTLSEFHEYCECDLISRVLDSAVDRVMKLRHTGNLTLRWIDADRDTIIHTIRPLRD
jgi:hypothetical protein